MTRTFSATTKKAKLLLASLAFVIISVGCTTFPAPEFKGIKGWINSEPLTLHELRGNVVLIDFWTYTCVNCIRTFPYLREWNAKYADDGLVIVGVHSPEFEFEKDSANVLQATKDNDITWAVAQDNDFKTWKNYGNKFWPAKYLIDKDGTVRYSHFGEGAYDKTEEWIRKLLIEAGADLTDDPMEPAREQVVDQSFIDMDRALVTRELFAGFVLAGIGEYVRQPEFFKNAGSVVELEAPDQLKPGVIYFDGSWVVSPEYTRHGKASTGYEDSLSLVYSARTLNAVLGSETGAPYQVKITVDGEYLTAENKGKDVTIAAGGESFLNVDIPRMYNVVDAPAYADESTLSMSSNSPDLTVYSFTFGVYETGP